MKEKRSLEEWKELPERDAIMTTERCDVVWCVRKLRWSVEGVVQRPALN
jgi:hypothetical protein